MLPRSKTLALAAGLLLAAPAHANLTLYPGPETPSGQGYRGTSDSLLSRFATDAQAISPAFKYSASNVKLGVRALRWDISGSVDELGNLGTNSSGYTETFANATNHAGAVVGHAKKYSPAGADLGTRAVRWDPDSSTAIELDNLGANASGYTKACATAINDIGTVAGYADYYDPQGHSLGTRAVRWDAGGTAATMLGDLGASGILNRATIANAINNNGAVVGRAQKYNTQGSDLGSRAVRWDPNLTVAVELQNLSLTTLGFADAEAKLVNDDGVVAGLAHQFNSSGFSLGPRPVRWDPSGAITPLGILGTKSDGSTADPQVNDINSDGVIIGCVPKYDAAGHSLGTRAVRWNPSSTAPVELATLRNRDGSEGGSTYAYAINHDGLTAGAAHSDIASYSTFSTFLTHAVLWTPTGRAIDLNAMCPTDAGWLQLIEARSISDTGWITGYGLTSGSPYQSFLVHVTYFSPGDFNLDGQVDSQDIDPFVTALADRSAYLAYLSDRMSTLAIDPGELDLILQFLDPSGDSLINVQDINPFIAALSAAGPLDPQSLALIPEPAALSLLLLAAPLLTRRR
ncbi:MAG: DUF3466 family protein [Phycisphaeraceae bacterium]|nr:DUF3466 family protein [Phycisphaeraceae bacterium]